MQGTIICKEGLCECCARDALTHFNADGAIVQVDVRSEFYLQPYVC